MQQAFSARYPQIEQLLNDSIKFSGFAPRNPAQDEEHCCAGQAVVQMTVRRGTMEQYAIKFFLSELAFKEESALYRQGGGVDGGDLAQFLPKVCSL